MSRPLGRRPGPTTTREEILDAATETFLEGRIEDATMRRIARRAGVDPSLIYRHFSGRDALFDEVIRRQFSTVFNADRPVRTGHDVVVLALDLWEDRSRRMLGLGAIRAALSNDQAATLLRELLSRTILRWIGPSARPDHRDLRIALVASHVVGMVVVRYRLQLPGLRQASREQLVRAVSPVVEHYLHGDLGLPTDPAAR